jgi:hypothetical protein
MHDPVRNRLDEAGVDVGERGDDSRAPVLRDEVQLEARRAGVDD